MNIQSWIQPGLRWRRSLLGVRGGGQKARYSQLVGAVARLVHAMSLFEQLEEFFNGNAWVRGTSQGKDLPHQHPERPAKKVEKKKRTALHLRNEGS